jgi:glycosyltransferase involved in cell wall biosynthesis
MDQYLIHPYEAHEGTNIGVHVSDGGYKKIVETGLLPAIEAIGARFTQTKVFFYGVQPERLADIRLLSHQKVIIPSEKTNRWMEVLPSLDIGILPKYSGFDQREGRESILEFMMMKVPWAASSGICCRELGQYGWLVQNNPATWERILDDMLNNLENYRAESAEGYIFALGQGIDENIDKLLAVCYSIKSDVFTGVV